MSSAPSSSDLSASLTCALRREKKTPVISRLAVCLIAAALSLGCRRRAESDTGASCAAVGAQLLSVARAQLARAPIEEPALRRSIEGLLAPIRDTMVRECRDGGWSAATRDCFAGATDEAAMRSCHQSLTEAQRTRLNEAAAGGDETLGVILGRLRDRAGLPAR